MRKATKERIRNIIGSAVRDGVTAGAMLLVVKKGEELFFDAQGYADAEREIPLRRDHIMRLFSMSKPVTAAAAMILFERGELDLGTPVKEIIPGFGDDYVIENGVKVKCGKEMSVLHLLNMTSGLTYGDGDTPCDRATAEILEEAERERKAGRPVSTLEFARRLGQAPRAFEPDSSWMYGFSADVLGAVIEVISGMRYGDFLEKEIFGPLGMKDSGFYVPAEKRERLAEVYHSRAGAAPDEGAGPGHVGADSAGAPRGADILRKMYHYKKDVLGIAMGAEVRPAFESGGAGLVSTVDDYMRFLRMLLNRGVLEGTRILSERTVKFLLSGDLTPDQQKVLRAYFGLEGFTYSHLLRQMRNPGQCAGMTRPGEFGWDSWTGCYAAGFPEDGLGFVFMEQKAECGTIPALRKIKNVLLLDPQV